MDSELLAGVALAVLGVIAFVLVVAAEAGVFVGVRERAMREPAESRLDALRRFYHERQLTLSALAFARNLALVWTTALVVFLIVDVAGHSWDVLVLTTLGAVAVIMLFQAFPRIVVARNPERWQQGLKPFVAFIRFAFRAPVMVLDAPIGVFTRIQGRQGNGHGH